MINSITCIIIRNSKIDGITSWISSLQLHLSLFHYTHAVCTAWTIHLPCSSYNVPIVSLSQSAHYIRKIFCVCKNHPNTNFGPGLVGTNGYYLCMHPSTWNNNDNNNNKTVSLFTVAVNRNEIFSPFILEMWRRDRHVCCMYDCIRCTCAWNPCAFHARQTSEHKTFE